MQLSSARRPAVSIPPHSDDGPSECVSAPFLTLTNHHHNMEHKSIQCTFTGNVKILIEFRSAAAAYFTANDSGGALNAKNDGRESRGKWGGGNTVSGVECPPGPMIH